MKVEIFSFENDESVEEAALTFNECHYEAAKVSPKEVLDHRSSWQEVRLSNNEVISIRVEFGKEYDVDIIVVKQNSESLLSITAKDILCVSFVTFSGFSLAIQLTM